MVELAILYTRLGSMHAAVQHASDMQKLREWSTDRACKSLKLEYYSRPIL